MSTFIHIGLHKTATSYLQSTLFPAIADGTLSYNPSSLTTMIKYLYRLRGAPAQLQQCRPQLIEKIQAQTTALESQTENLLLSYESFSQFEFIQNYQENAVLLKQLFPKAKIILFLRFQPNWLLSLYKQSVATGDHQCLAEFLNFYDGHFHNTQNLYNKQGLLHVNALEADWARLIHIYTELFGRDNIHIYFFEDFCKHPDATAAALCQQLGVKAPQALVADKVNVGLSARTINALVHRRRLLSMLGMGQMLYSIQRERMHYHRKLASAIRSLGITVAPHPSGLRRPKILTKGPLLKHYLDKVAAKDWDILAQDGIRDMLTAYYRQKNQALLEWLPQHDIPTIYLDEPKSSPLGDKQ